MVVLGLVDPSNAVAAHAVGSSSAASFISLIPRGLPIPGHHGEGVASLDDLAGQPELLRQLDVNGGSQYPVNEKT